MDWAVRSVHISAGTAVVVECCFRAYSKALFQTAVGMVSKYRRALEKDAHFSMKL